ncbi:hypothetical protein Tco_0077735 [Tanacetum coccineum]
MITYLKNIGRSTYNQLKNKSFEEIQNLYEKVQKWLKDFIPIDSEEGGKKAASRKKRPRAELDEESCSLVVTTATRHGTAGDHKYWCFTDAKKCLKRYGRKEHFILPKGD